jgi:hypothetical protein
MLLVPLLASACGGASRGRVDAPVGGAPGPTGALVAGTDRMLVTLDSVAVGYDDCTVSAVTEAGEEVSYYADDDLCPGEGRDASPLVERKVRLTLDTRTHTPPCDGDEESCADVQPAQVRWVIAIEPAE